MVRSTPSSVDAAHVALPPEGGPAAASLPFARLNPVLRGERLPADALEANAVLLELAKRNITVNCVAPGFMRSAMTDVLPEAQKAALLSRIPAGDLGTGDDVAAAVVYLASKEAGYVTGQTLHVNGGMAML